MMDRIRGTRRLKMPIVLDPRAAPSIFLALTLPLEIGAPGLLLLLRLLLLLLGGLEFRTGIFG